MKTIKSFFIATVFLALSLTSKAQIALEQVYDSASTGAGELWCHDSFSQLMVINFEVDGERYVKINRCGNMIEIYDLTHTLIKTISLASLPHDYFGHLNDILYLSQHLFTSDSKISFMYVFDQNDASGNSHGITNIYNEDAMLLFSDTSGPYVHVNVEMQQYPIVNTSTGTKMILSDWYSGRAKVFSLPGQLSSSMLANNVQLIQAQPGLLARLYPNPGNGAVTLQFELPEGEKKGELILYDVQGGIVKRYKVDNTMQELKLDNSELSAGTYFYELQTSQGSSGSKKMIVVK